MAESKKDKKKWIEFDDENEEDERKLRPHTEITHYQREKKEPNGTIITETVRQLKRIIPVRKCVKERKEWQKFGEVANTNRGEHHQGDYLEGQNVRIETLDSTHKEEINIVNQIYKINTETIRQRKINEKIQQLEHQKANEEKPADKQTQQTNAEFPALSNQKQIRTRENNQHQSIQFDETNTTLQIRNILSFMEAGPDQLKAYENDFRIYIDELLKSLGSKYQIKFLYRDDKKTKKQQLRDTVYIEFYEKSHAQSAMLLIKDKAYSNAVMQVDWAKPRRDKK